MAGVIRATITAAAATKTAGSRVTTVARVGIAVRGTTTIGVIRKAAVKAATATATSTLVSKATTVVRAGTAVRVITTTIAAAAAAGTAIRAGIRKRRTKAGAIAMTIRAQVAATIHAARARVTTTAVVVATGMAIRRAIRRLRVKVGAIATTTRVLAAAVLHLRGAGSRAMTVMTTVAAATADGSATRAATPRHRVAVGKTAKPSQTAAYQLRSGACSSDGLENRQRPY